MKSEPSMVFSSKAFLLAHMVDVSDVAFTSAAEMRSAVMERLAEATVEDNHACILDSCVEAVSRFS